jgi:hypothetical protein
MKASRPLGLMTMVQQPSSNTAHLANSWLPDCPLFLSGIIADISLQIPYLKIVFV